MDYPEAISWIIERAGYDKGFVANPFLGDEVAALGLRRTASLLRRLGNPQSHYRIVHVAGTKGKGSTAATIAAVARSSGMVTGLYATPHLHTFRERIQINGTLISEADFATVAEIVAPADVAVRAEESEIGEPTAFEVATVMALLAFQRAEVDLAVIEVGMGGRLDATNVVVPEVSVITPVSYDHTAILGDTLPEIAREKGGIVKRGRPVVVGPQQPEVLEELTRIAEAMDAPVYRAGRDWQIELGDDGARFNGPWGDWHDVDLALAGRHQADNAGVALMSLWLLDPALLENEERVRQALANVHWPGRFEHAASSPDVYVDGAHNVDSVERLVQTVRDLLPGRPTIVVLGVSQDKDVEGMLRALATLQPHVIASASHNPRAADPQRIAAAAREVGLDACVSMDVPTALDEARSLARAQHGVVLVTGSLYAVAEAREALGLAETPAFERSLLY